MPEPVAAPTTKKRYSKSSAERVGSGTPNAAPKKFVEEHHAPVEPPKDPRKERLFILIEDPSKTDDLTAIRRLCDINLGFQDVILVLKDGEEKKPLRMPFKVDACDDLIKKLKEIVGENNVKIS